ncbi:hypothetical protein J3D47_003767 [Pseudomonas laurylsulfativorans]|nr:hypothetical protein [Pseudomonas laurylsulfativorans]
MLAMDDQTTRASRYPALSLTFIASELAPTGESESTLFGVFAEIPGSSLSRVFFIPKEL